MTDIVERLRDGCGCNYPETTCMAESECADAFAAADEIERLRAVLKQLAKYSADEDEMDWADTVLEMNDIARAALKTPTEAAQPRMERSDND